METCKVRKNFGGQFNIVLNVCVVAEDSDGQRVPAAVGDRLSDQRVVQNHPERHRQTGETHMQSCIFNVPLLY